MQEIMTDPSYKGQFVAFTCPHIGNVGINDGEHCTTLLYASMGKWALQPIRRACIADILLRACLHSLLESLLVCRLMCMCNCAPPRTSMHQRAENGYLD